VVSLKEVSKHQEMQIKELSQIVMEQWQNNFILTGKWWVLLVLSIVPWLIWWKVVDKKRISEILLLGFLVIIMATFFDIVGWNYSGWYYPNTLLALCTPLFPIDYTLLPILYMLIFQYFSKWKTFIVAVFIMSAAFSFILEPLGEWMNIYKELKWKSIYSFPVYILLGIFVKWFVEKIIRVKKSA
jgi:hypothetical protein